MISPNPTIHKHTPTPHTNKYINKHTQSILYLLERKKKKVNFSTIDGVTVLLISTRRLYTIHGQYRISLIQHGHGRELAYTFNFFVCYWFPDISWADIWMMPLWHHWAFWNKGDSKWPHRIKIGAKMSKCPNVTFTYIKSFVLPPGFQNCFSFFDATHGSRVMELQRSKVNSRFVQGRKNKVTPIFLNKVSNCSSLQEDSEKY